MQFCTCIHVYSCKLCNCTCTSVCAHVMSSPVTVLGMSGSDKGSGVGDESAEAEDEFPQVQVEDSSSYMEQLDSEVSHLVCHTHVQNLQCTCTNMYMYVQCTCICPCIYQPQFTGFVYVHVCTYTMYMYMYVLYTCTCARQVCVFPADERYNYSLRSSDTSPFSTILNK